MTDIADSSFINIAPEPATGMGICRLVAQLDGENVVRLDSHIGFSHRGIEKLLESVNTTQALAYCGKLCRSVPFAGGHAFVLAAEKLAGIEVPKRAKQIRTLLSEIARVSALLTMTGNLARDTGNASAGAIAAAASLRATALCRAVAGFPFDTYFRVGGVAVDVRDGFSESVKAWLSEMPAVLDELKRLIDNGIFRSRTQKIGCIETDDALAAGLTGDNARASGVKRDIRTDEPYDACADLEFGVPVSKDGDCYARYQTRIAGIYQSLSLIAQLLPQFSAGEINAFKQPETATLTGLSTHFENVVNGLPLPEGGVYAAIESPFGETGVYLQGDGSPVPYRCHIRSAGFAAMQTLSKIAVGAVLVDIRPIVSSLGVLMTEVDR